MKINSSVIFNANKDGTYNITGTTKIGGVVLKDITFSRGVKVANIELADLVGKELDVEKEGNVYVIKGYYKNE